MVSFNSFLSTNKESCLNGTWASKEITRSTSVKRNFIEKKLDFFLVDYKQLFDDFRKKIFRTLSEGCTKVSDHFPTITKKGIKGGAEVRAVAFNQSGPGSNLGINAICG